MNMKNQLTNNIRWITIGLALMCLPGQAISDSVQPADKNGYNIHQKDMCLDSGHLCEGGIYIYQIEAEGKRVSGQLVLIK